MNIVVLFTLPIWTFNKIIPSGCEDFHANSDIRILWGFRLAKVFPNHFSIVCGSGTYVEGNYLQNKYQWKDTVGPWEERPGHFNDIWNYWSDDGIGYFEYLQLTEDLGTLPVWVFNAGIRRHDKINTSNIAPYVQDALDGIEFAKGSPRSKWGSVRAAMGHPKPFDLRFVAIGNEDCGLFNYEGNYLRFHDAIRYAYPDIKIISNCDASTKPLNHPADLFDYHIYTDSNGMFSKSTQFDHTSRSGPKAFVSEYAVWRKDSIFP
ncbi:alpha-L-arabinofuranosidase 2-like [Cajanus cajan]|uniref:alpha-L-arabinofuranosidase 2-like n=1 Tax=Cajanus cajan TaxID=3821 RepID=UPI0010FB3371|nr:alpha-L-arabinofuranosidase 2-like [Cajanus cajan]